MDGDTPGLFIFHYGPIGEYKHQHRIEDNQGPCIVDPPADLISALKLRVLGELWFFAEAG